MSCLRIPEYAGKYPSKQRESVVLQHWNSMKVLEKGELKMGKSLQGTMSVIKNLKEP